MARALLDGGGDTIAWAAAPTPTKQAAAVAAPAVVAPAVAPAAAAPSGAWFDPAKWDAGNPLAGLLTLVAPRVQEARDWTARDASGEVVNLHDDATYVSTNGTRLAMNADGTYTDTYDDPAGKSSHDKLAVTYKVVNGQAVPVAAVHNYQAGDWVGQMRDTVATFAAVVLAGIGGALLGGSTAAAEGVAVAPGAELLSGMDLAADAVVGSGNYIGTAASVFGSGAVAGAAPVAETLSGMDLAADAAVGTGNNIGTAAGSFSSWAAPVDAVSGMDLAADAAPGTGNNIATAASQFTSPAISAADSLVQAAKPTAASGAASTTAGGLLSGANELANLVGKGAALVGALTGGSGTSTTTPTQATQAAAQRSNFLALLGIGGAVFFALKG